MHTEAFVEVLTKLTQFLKGTNEAPIDPQLSNIKPFDRKFALLHLLWGTGYLDRNQIRNLARQLYTDVCTEQVRPLFRVAVAAGVLEGSSPLRHNPFLNHVGLKYDRESMEREYHTIAPPGTPPRGMVDLWAGSGPPRIVLKEFYSLHSLGLANCDRLLTTGERIELVDESFVPTHHGKGFAEDIDFVFQKFARYTGSRSYLVVLDKYGNYNPRRGLEVYPNPYGEAVKTL